MYTLNFKLITGAVLFSLAASCAIDTFAPNDDEDALHQDGEDDVGSISSPIRKGLPGAANGDTDYCNGTELCNSGEGDCDRSSQCAAGTVCGMNKGAQFGFAANIDVCVPAHCTNRRMDGDETQPDCGGSCGTTCATHACIALPAGHKDKCVAGACVCTQGQGDCDSHADCAPGLSCVMNNGPKFGLPATYDVCAPAHCSNRRLDGDETAVDCGGSCGTQGACEAGPACPGLTAITYRWLATACDTSIPISFAINGSPSLNTSHSYTCSCTPGVRSQTITDPAVLALVTPGDNSFALNANHGSLLLAWATVTLEFQSGSPSTTVMYDTNGGSTNPEDLNLCLAGFAGAQSPVQTVAVLANACN